MRASVLKTYIDKDSGKQILAGSTIECAEDRGRFLAEKGYVKLADVEKAEPVAPVEEKAVARPKPVAKKAPAKATTKKKESK